MQVSLAEVGNDLRTCNFLRTGNKLSLMNMQISMLATGSVIPTEYYFAIYSEAYMFIASCFS
jgi:hypothetical protein